MIQTAQILDGKATSKVLLEKVRLEITQLTSPVKPKLVVVLVGESPASEVYVARKIKVSQELGLTSELHRFPATLTESVLKTHLEQLNADSGVHAVLVQLPLPKQINTETVLQTVSPQKDVDGFHPENIGRLLLGIEPPAMPCTPAGIIQLLDAYKIDLEGMRAAVVGRSNIVGKPVTLMLTHRNATVTLCHSKTKDLDGILKESDLVVAAAGQPGLIRAESIKPGAVVVDVGINRLPSGALVGDVDFESARERAGYITPVPGGVGPMTIAMLMRNTLRLYQAQQGQCPPSLLFTH
jgi:methylenetetrahydrofolate dehydrogenase (NADP+) / methenyltetrahydrofolate cyclohydrolase